MDVHDDTYNVVCCEKKLQTALTYIEDEDFRGGKEEIQNAIKTLKIVKEQLKDMRCTITLYRTQEGMPLIN